MIPKTFQLSLQFFRSGAPRAKARDSSTCFVGRNPPKHTLLRSFGASKGTLPTFIPGLKTRGFLRRRGRVNQKFIRILFFPQHVIQFDIGERSKNVSFHPMVLFAQGLDDLLDLLSFRLSRTGTTAWTKRQIHLPSKSSNLLLLHQR